MTAECLELNMASRTMPPLIDTGKTVEEGWKESKSWRISRRRECCKPLSSGHYTAVYSEAYLDCEMEPVTTSLCS